MMPPDVEGALTRKLGPLPAWGWGVAIGGAILAARLLRKPSGTASATPAATTIGSGPSDVIGTGPDATPTDVFSGANSLVQQLQDKLTGQEQEIAGLSGTINTLTNYQQLQTQLSDLLKQRADALYQLSKWATAKNGAQDALSKCKTAACKSKYTAAIKTDNTNIANYTKQAADLNTEIGKLQDQISKLGATS